MRAFGGERAATDRMMSLIVKARGAASSAAEAMEKAEQLRRDAEGGGGGIQEEDGAAPAVPGANDLCSECNKLGATVRCPCLQNVYCSQKCYKKHWKQGDHMKQCRYTLAKELNLKALLCAREAHNLYQSLGPEHAADAQKAWAMISLLEGVSSAPVGAGGVSGGWSSQLPPAPSQQQPPAQPLVPAQVAAPILPLPAMPAIPALAPE